MLAPLRKPGVDEEDPARNGLPETGPVPVGIKFGESGAIGSDGGARVGSLESHIGIVLEGGEESFFGEPLIMTYYKLPSVVIVQFITERKGAKVEI